MDAIGGGVFVILGSVFLALLFTGTWQGKASLQWPTVEGEIVVIAMLAFGICLLLGIP